MAEFAFIMARVQVFGWEVKLVSLPVELIVPRSSNLLLHSGTTVSLLPDTYPHQDLDLSQTLCRICKDLRVCGVIAAGYNTISFPPMSTSLNLRLLVIGNDCFLLLAILVQAVI